MTTRIDPVSPPYPPRIAERLDAMMPPGEPPILLFRTFVRNLPMTAAMSGLGWLRAEQTTLAVDA